MEQEIWYDIPNWKGQFKISNFGNVLKFKNGEWSPQKLSIDTKGYYKFTKSVNGKSHYMPIHNILCKILYGERHDGDWVVDHIDDNKLNNHHSNLRWITRSENTVKSNKNKKSFFGPPRKLVQKDVTTGEIIQEFPSMGAAAKAIGVSHHAVQIACKKHTKCKGFVLEFV